MSALQPYPTTIRLLEGSVQSTQVSLFHVVHMCASHWPRQRQFGFPLPWFTCWSEVYALNLWDWITTFSTECGAKNTLLSGTWFTPTTVALGTNCVRKLPLSKLVFNNTVQNASSSSPTAHKPEYRAQGGLGRKASRKQLLSNRTLEDPDSFTSVLV